MKDKTDMAHKVPCGRSCRRTKECWAFYMREWTRKNRDRTNAQQNARYAAETEVQHARRRANGRRWYAEHKELMVQRRREMKARNPEHFRAYFRNYVMERRNRMGGRIDPKWAETLRADPCSYCGGPGGEVDHIIPVALGGSNDSSNLTGSCRSCNASKHDKTLLGFLHWRLAA